MLEQAQVLHDYFPHKNPSPKYIEHAYTLSKHYSNLFLYW